MKSALPENGVIGNFTELADNAGSSDHFRSARDGPTEEGITMEPGL